MLHVKEENRHTNIPGSRNRKRYEDVEELLAAGINVMSTVNIQHMESLNDVIDRITGVKVRETFWSAPFAPRHGWAQRNNYVHPGYGGHCAGELQDRPVLLPPALS